MSKKRAEEPTTKFLMQIDYETKAKLETITEVMIDDDGMSTSMAYVIRRLVRKEFKRLLRTMPEIELWVAQKMEGYKVAAPTSTPAAPSEDVTAPKKVLDGTGSDMLRDDTNL